MSLPSVTIAYIADGMKLVKEHAPESPRFSLIAMINKHWVVVNQWDDPGHVASLLVHSGYEADFQSALNLLNLLKGH